MEEQIIKSISINAKEIDAKYMERRKAVLEKHPDDIEAAKELLNRINSELKVQNKK